MAKNPRENFFRRGLFSYKSADANLSERNNLLNQNIVPMVVNPMLTKRQNRGLKDTFVKDKEEIYNDDLDSLLDGSVYAAPQGSKGYDWKHADEYFHSAPLETQGGEVVHNTVETKEMPVGDYYIKSGYTIPFDTTYIQVGGSSIPSEIRNSWKSLLMELGDEGEPIIEDAEHYVSTHNVEGILPDEIEKENPAYESFEQSPELLLSGHSTGLEIAEKKAAEGSAQKQDIRQEPAPNSNRPKF